MTDWQYNAMHWLSQRTWILWLATWATFAGSLLSAVHLVEDRGNAIGVAFMGGMAGMGLSCFRLILKAAAATGARKGVR